MSVTAVRKDTAARTMTITAEYDAAPAAAWALWADPRKLERWWGPPSHPATVVDHDLAVGGRVTYYMTSPEGEQFHGWWQVRAVQPPSRLEFEDGFADATGTPAADMPTALIAVTLADRTGGGTLMTITTTYPSTEAMEQMLAMGMEEGITAALGQTDALLDEEPAPTG